MSGVKKCLLLIIAIVSLSVPGIPSMVHAANLDHEVEEGNQNRFGNTSPWLKDTQDESIYSNSVDAGEEKQDIVVKSPGQVEKYVAELIRNVSSSLISLLQDKIGASLDAIIYGRVGSGQPNKVNIFGFELRKGNPYGVTAAVCYALLRGMMFIFLAITFLFQLAKAAWSGQTAKSRDEIKSIMPMMLVKFVALMLMPYLLDVALYIRDVLLYGIKEVTGQMITGGATLSLSQSFLLNAERSGTLVDAIMYLGTVVLTMYFIFLYVAIACDMMICFVAFPFVCVFQSQKRDLIGHWIATVFSNLMTPVIDAVLLLVPLLTSLMLSDVIQGVAIIQLVMCMLIIPARVKFKELLGIQSNERNGFLGAMAVMSLAKAVAGGIKKGVGRATEAYSDAKKSRMHGELAEVDREEEAAYLSGGSSQTNNREGRADDFLGQHGDDDRQKGIELQENQEDDLEEWQEKGYESRSEEWKDENEAEDRSLEEEPVGQNPYIPDEDTARGSELDMSVQEDKKEPAQSRNDLLRDMDNDMEQAQENIDDLRVQRADLVQQEKQMKRQMLDQERGSEAYRDLEKKRAEIESQSAKIDGKIASENQRLNQLRKQSKDLRASMGVHNTPTTFDDRRAEILKKRANISNFEQPEFKGILSNEQMKELYRKRAVANVAKLAVGTGSAIATGTAAGGAAVFMGPSAVAMATAGGIQAGGAIGETTVDAAIEMKRIAAPAVGAARKKAYQAADMAASAYLMNKIKPAAMQADISRMPPVASFRQEADPAERTGAPDIPEAELKGSQVQKQIISDTSQAMNQLLDTNGNMKNSKALLAMQQANLQVEKEIAVMREENVVLTDGTMREKRILAQTEALSNEVLKRMSGYEKGTETYRTAKRIVMEKIKTILEEKNRPLL